MPPSRWKVLLIVFTSIERTVVVDKQLLSMKGHPMKTYQVVGLGNALVDQEYQVKDAFLAQQGIEKGMMTLLDETQQTTLIQALKEQSTLIKRVSGGSAANTMVALSQFGASCFYCCKVAQDEAGHFYRQNLSEAGVAHQLDQQDYQGDTGRCVVMVTDDAQRTMCTYLGITSDLSTAEVSDTAIQDSHYLYIEGYLVTSDIARQAVAHARQVAKQAGTKIALTFSDPSMVTYFKEAMAEFVEPGVDLLFCNEEEALTYTGQTSIEDAAKHLLQFSQEVVITQGPQGAWVFQQDQQTYAPGVPVKRPVDTNGAGDMFAGAYLYGLSQGWSVAQAAELANRAAATLIQTYGARLTKEQHQELLQATQA